MNDDAEDRRPGPWGRLSRGRRVTVVVLALAVVWLLSAVPFPGYDIPSEASQPTVQRGDHVRVNRWAYAYGDPDRGDLVVFDALAGQRPGRRLSRVVAIGGDIVEGRGGGLVVNGQSVTESYLAAGTRTSDFQPVTVAKGSVFVLGDNRNNSEDSRLYGPILGSLLRGRVMMITRPLGHIGLL